MRLPAIRAARIGMVVIALLMSGVMAAVMTAWNTGIGVAFWTPWPRSWAMGFLISLPVALVVIPIVVRWQSRVSR